MQSFVGIGWVYFKLEHSKFWSYLNFNRNIASGTGSRSGTGWTLDHWGNLSTWINSVINLCWCHGATQILVIIAPGNGLPEPTRTTRTPAFWDTPRRPMITHTSDSHQIPSQNNTKSKLQILKIAKISNFEILPETLHATHFLKLLYKMHKYEMDPTRTVEATERTRDAGRTDGQTDRRTKWVKPIYMSIIL